MVPPNIAWHKENNTYGFAYGLGILIVSIGTLVLLGLFFPKVGLIGDCLLIIMTAGTLSFLITTPETWVPDLGGPNHGFPYLSGAGRLVIKDIAMMAGGFILLGTDFKRILEIFKKYDVRYFFYNGGNDSMDTCNKISRYMQAHDWECRVMGVPKTIDLSLIHISEPTRPY